MDFFTDMLASVEHHLDRAIGGSMVIETEKQIDIQPENNQKVHKIGIGSSVETDSVTGSETDLDISVSIGLGKKDGDTGVLMESDVKENRDSCFDSKILDNQKIQIDSNDNAQELKIVNQDERKQLLENVVLSIGNELQSNEKEKFLSENLLKLSAANEDLKDQKNRLEQVIADFEEKITSL